MRFSALCLFLFQNLCHAGPAPGTRVEAIFMQNSLILTCRITKHRPPGLVWRPGRGDPYRWCCGGLRPVFWSPCIACRSGVEVVRGLAETRVRSSYKVGLVPLAVSHQFNHTGAHFNPSSMKLLAEITLPLAIPRTSHSMASTRLKGVGV